MKNTAFFFLAFYVSIHSASADDLNLFAEDVVKKEWVLEHSKVPEVIIRFKSSVYPSENGAYEVRKRRWKQTFWSKLFSGDIYDVVATGSWAPASATNHLVVLFNPILPDDLSQPSFSMGNNFLGLLLIESPVRIAKPTLRQLSIIPLTLWPTAQSHSSFREDDWVNKPIGEYKGRSVYTNRSGWARFQELKAGSM